MIRALLPVVLLLFSGCVTTPSRQRPPGGSIPESPAVNDCVDLAKLEPHVRAACESALAASRR
jgi:hypothetical protein